MEKLDKTICRLAITGEIGAGKSTVAGYITQSGIPVLDLDSIAKKLMVTDEYLRAEIKAEFGDQAYTGHELNKKYLSEKAFKVGAVHRLNALVHPRVDKEVAKLESKIAQQGHRIIAKESALLLQHGRPNEIDVVIWVKTSIDIRRNRISNRPNLSQSDRDARIKYQSSLNLSQYLNRDRDKIIENNGTLQKLKTEVSWLTKELKNVCDTLFQSHNL
tara:strand:- start:47 stop:697 length:651 start_codon:yes stop_codon:yes gene_type:complete